MGLNRSSPNVPFATSFYSYKGSAQVSRNQYALEPCLEWENPLHINTFSVKQMWDMVVADPPFLPGAWLLLWTVWLTGSWKLPTQERLGGFVFNHHWEPIRRTRYHAAIQKAESLEIAITEENPSTWRLGPGLWLLSDWCRWQGRGCIHFVLNKTIFIQGIQLLSPREGWRYKNRL